MENRLYTAVEQPNVNALNKLINIDREKGNLDGKLEDTMEAQNMGVKVLNERVWVLDERVGLLSKFTIKVTHAVATTMQLLKGNQDDDLN